MKENPNTKVIMMPLPVVLILKNLKVHNVKNKIICLVNPKNTNKIGLIFDSIVPNIWITTCWLLFSLIFLIWIIKRIIIKIKDMNAIIREALPPLKNVASPKYL